MKTLKEKIEVMQAALDGKEIEKCFSNNEWVDINSISCQWDWNNYDYRIKPEPLEFWIDVWEATRGTKETYLSMSGDRPEFKKEYNEIKKIKTIKMREVI